MLCFSLLPSDIKHLPAQQFLPNSRLKMEPVHKFVLPMFVLSLILSSLETSNAGQNYRIARHQQELIRAPLSSSFSKLSASSIFNVKSFGAVGNGFTDDTEAFRKAWTASCSAESGTLLVPSNYIFLISPTIFSGPCNSSLFFQVDGVLLAPDRTKWWQKNMSSEQWLVFDQVDGLTLGGRGTIEGNGEEWWNLPCKPHRGPNGSTLPGICPSPPMIKFLSSSNLSVKDLKIQNSPQFHIKFEGCDHVHVKHLSISSPANSPNTDGIHLHNSRHVGIHHSAISTGDDCISIGSGSSMVDIESITCGHGHGISIGSLGNDNSEACVSKISVRNCVIRNSDNGVRIKTRQGGTGSVSEVSFSSVFMHNVRNSIIIDQYYCDSGALCDNQTSAVRISGVSYKSIKGTYDARAPPVHLACSDSVPCTNITMSDVALVPFRGKSPGDEAFCWNVYGERKTRTVPPVLCIQKGMPQPPSSRGSNGFQC